MTPYSGYQVSRPYPIGTTFPPSNHVNYVSATQWNNQPHDEVVLKDGTVLILTDDTITIYASLLHYNTSPGMPLITIDRKELKQHG